MGLLEENVCKDFSNCIDCRNSFEFRKKAYDNGYVHQIEFACPKNIPISHPQDKNITRPIKPDEADVLLALKKLRRLISGEALEPFSVLVKALFPDGVAFDCIYQQKTEQKLLVPGTNVYDRQIYCCCPGYNTVNSFLMEHGCTAEKCKHFKDKE